MPLSFAALRAGPSARVSLSAAGAALPPGARNPRFSPDGRAVAFETTAALTPNDANGSVDVYERDLDTGTLVRLTDGHLGEAGSNGAANLRYGPRDLVVFDSLSFNLAREPDNNGHRDVFVRDRTSGAVTLASVTAAGVLGNGESSNGVLSPDGRLVAFESLATNLTGADTNGARDLFLKNLDTGALARVSVSAAGAQANGQSSGASFSPDGTLLLFESNASNLVDGDSNGRYDLFVRNLATGAVTRVSVTAGGTQANGHSFRGSFTPDGRAVLFESEASNLVANDTNAARDIFLRDLVTGAVTRVSERADGGQLNGTSQNAAFAAGRVVFESDATNAVPGDGNMRRDVFVRDLTTGRLERLSLGPDGAEPNGDSWNARLAPDGLTFVYESSATNLVADDANGQRDIFSGRLIEITAASTARVAANAPASDALWFMASNGSRVASATAAAPPGALGRVELTLIADGTGEAPGKLRWTFVGAPELAALAVGEERIETHRVTLTDQTGGTAATDLTLTIVGANDTPVANPDAVRLTAGQVLDMTALLLGNDRDPDEGDALSIVAVGTARVGEVMFDAATGRVTYLADTPALATLSASGTTDSFTYTVRDRWGATATATVTVDIESGLQVLNGTPGNDVLSASGPGWAELRGFDGRDRLTGAGGPDLLDGGAGADTLAGGGGDDIYVVDSLSDVLVELPGGGWDTIRTPRAFFTLPAEFEELTFIGVGTTFDGRGNAAANRLSGGDGADRLEGMDGDDQLVGGRGRDFLRGGNGADRLDGGPDADTLRGELGADVFVLRRGETAGDLIQDFRSVDGDRLLLEGWSAGTTLSYNRSTRTAILTDSVDGWSETLTITGDPGPASLFFG